VAVGSCVCAGTVGGAVSVGAMVAATGAQLTITNANPTIITGSFFMVTFLDILEACLKRLVITTF
jgi:hypothetical protein